MANAINMLKGNGIAAPLFFLNGLIEIMKSKLIVELGKKLVRCYIWIIVLYGSETWIQRKLKRRYWNASNVVLKENGKDKMVRELK